MLRILDRAVIGLGTASLLGAGAAISHHAEHSVNHTAVDESATPVTVTTALASSYRPSRSYVGTLQPWDEANIGPQFVSAYVETVLVRPGEVVRRGQVLATLDCANASAGSRAIAMRARGLAARQRALEDESKRLQELLDGGFAAVNDVEQKKSLSLAEQALLLEAEATLAQASLDVQDCALRAPFDGEIATRSIDPGAFVRPGTTLLGIVDRNTIRVTADAPEKDFDVVAPATAVRIGVVSTSRTVDALVSRRSPKADTGTRTVHFEVDVPDPQRELPVGTTGMVQIDVGKPLAASEIPLYAATVHGNKAKLFVVIETVAHLREVVVLGQAAGKLYLDPAALPAGSRVVTEGRATLSDGAAVQPMPESPPTSESPGATPARGGGIGRPM